MFIPGYGTPAERPGTSRTELLRKSRQTGCPSPGGDHSGGAVPDPRTRVRPVSPGQTPDAAALIANDVVRGF